MTQAIAQDVLRTGFLTVISVAGPILAVAMIVGLLISVLQATTQVQEQTLTFVPKMIAVLLSLVLFGNYMLSTLMDFVSSLFNVIVNL